MPLLMAKNVIKTWFIQRNAFIGDPQENSAFRTRLIGPLPEGAQMADLPINRYVCAMRALRIHILVLDDCTAFVPIGLADMFRKSAQLAASLPSTANRREIAVSLTSATGDRVVSA